MTTIYSGIHHVGTEMSGYDIYLIVYLCRHRHGIYVQFEGMTISDEHSLVLNARTTASHLQKIQTLAPGWNADLVSRATEIIRRWHNNHRRKTCPHLDALSALSGQLEYGTTCDFCRTHYGINYYFEPLPDEVVQFVRELPGRQDTLPH
jgi:hypothetical protein